MCVRVRLGSYGYCQDIAAGQCVLSLHCVYSRRRAGKERKKYTAEMKSAVDKQERNCCFFSSDDSRRLTASPLLIILCFRVCVCMCVACTDTELHSLAARLKDWFGVLHLDANRDLKSSDSFDSATGREYIPLQVCVCVHACVCACVCVLCLCAALFLLSSHAFQSS